jgi:hypothetical protein
MSPEFIRDLGQTVSELANHVQFVMKAVSSTCGASEFRQSMRPHPLVYQELPHEPR